MLTRPSRYLSIGIVLLAAMVRLVWLDSAPPAINQDEAVHAWDANCLLKTGKDHSGARWPVFCHAYGKRESHASPFIYSIIPFQAVLGMNVWSTRLPGALMGTLAVPLLFWLVRAWYGNRAGLLAALLLAISPWHIHLSRLAFEVSVCPTLLVGGMLLFSRGVQVSSEPAALRKSAVTFFVAGLTLGLLLWTYNAYRVFVPIIVAVGVLLYPMRLWRFVGTLRGRWAAFSFTVGIFIGVSPFIWACLKTPDKAWGRAHAEFVLNRAKTLGEAAQIGFKTYLHQLSPDFLFQNGDPSITQSIPGHGQLYLICGVFLIAGLLRVILRWRTEAIGRFLIIWLILAPVPAGLTKLSAGHALRAATALPAYQILSALGVEWILQWAAARSKRFGLATAGLIGAGFICSAVHFFNLFFRVYSVVCAPFFWSELKPVVEEVIQREKAYDMVLLSSHDCRQNGTLFLFWSRTEPDEYFQAPLNIWEGPEWDALLQMGKYFFVPYSDLPSLVSQLPPELKRLRVLVAERPGLPVPGEVLRRFSFPDGQEAMVLYDVTVVR